MVEGRGVRPGPIGCNRSLTCDGQVIKTIGILAQKSAERRDVAERIDGFNAASSEH
jgi:hypothetical protein